MVIRFGQSGLLDRLAIRTTVVHFSRVIKFRSERCVVTRVRLDANMANFHYIAATSSASNITRHRDHIAYTSFLLHNGDRVILTGRSIGEESRCGSCPSIVRRIAVCAREKERSFDYSLSRARISDSRSSRNSSTEISSRTGTKKPSTSMSLACSSPMPREVIYRSSSASTCPTVAE